MIVFYGLQAQKEEKSLDTDERVLQLLQDCEEPVQTIDIAKALGFKTAKQVGITPSTHFNHIKLPDLVIIEMLYYLKQEVTAQRIDT